MVLAVSRAGRILAILGSALVGVLIGYAVIMDLIESGPVWVVQNVLYKSQQKSNVPRQ